ncbi:NAD(+) diphosphatase [Thiopseudomonas alkaliphila]|uniref:NAD(+) diphosphatase n=1 Tax=Thiopseudomonas alkaliphila TaxID=1697053 RepID=UPI0025765BE4|nr:NAD(+) diphosphatase [Thiopseudomonas alkaliphila]MDM1707848.1 NAD(+) diphosphatase [Thiopseudomonas alkaliphila]
MSVAQLGWRNGFPPLTATDKRILVQFKTRFLSFGTSLLHTQAALRWLEAEAFPLQPLGWLQGAPIYLLQLKRWPVSAALEQPVEWVSLREYLDLYPPDFYQMLSYASQIGTWLNDHQYCGRCAEPMRQMPEQRLMQCPVCQLQQYPRISPSMIVLVTKGDQLLLAQGRRFKSAMYSVLAGFAEPAETIEHCVAREVYEEVQLEITNIRYVTSQSWPFPHSLMLGFIADYVAGNIVIQQDELRSAEWFSLDQLPILPDKGTISRYLIDSYLEERQGQGSANPVLPR